MPPQKRVKKRAVELPVSVEDQVGVSPGRPVDSSSNKRGFPALPVELLLEIVSYFRLVNYPGFCDRSKRSWTLRVLSQTCRSLRCVFLSILWERLCIKALAHYMYDAGKSLERKSEALAHDTELAGYVRVVIVEISKYATVSVLLDFGRCLSALPNIHTIHADYVHSKMNNDLIIAFEGLRLPSVRTIRLPTHAHRVLRCCPEVRRIICIGGDGGRLPTAITEVCKNVEVLEGFQLHEKYMKRFVKAVPNLQVIKIRGSGSPDTLELLSTLRKITTIELESDRPKQIEGKRIDHSPDFKSCLDAAKNVLLKQSCAAKGKKCLRIRYCGGGDVHADEFDEIEVEQV